MVNYGFVSSSFVGNYVNRGMRQFGQYLTLTISSLGRDMLGLVGIDSFNNCGETILGDDYIDFDWLNIANIQYLISLLPLKEHQRIRLVSDPNTDLCGSGIGVPTLFGRGAHLFGRLNDRLDYSRSVYVY